MAVKFPTGADVLLLDALITAKLNGALLKLYSNNHVPADGDTAANFTECTFPGYAAIALDSWTPSGVNVDNKAETTEIKRTFEYGTPGAPQDVYGIFVTTVSGDLLFAENYPGGVVSMRDHGQEYSYTPRITLRSEF